MEQQRHASGQTETILEPQQNIAMHELHSSRPELIVDTSGRTQEDAERPGQIGGVDRSDEQSPLLSPGINGDGDTSLVSASGFASRNSANAIHNNGEQTSSVSSWHLFLLTFAMFGVHIAWSVEFSYGSPYLLSLGVPKSMLSFIWIAGPLTGALVHPYIGVKSDQCRSRFGKRRPFMVGGAIGAALSMLAFAWCEKIAAGFLGLFGTSGDEGSITTTSIVLAAVLVYILDFSINVVQAATRAFIVDNAPLHQQDAANAWASRVSGVGSLVEYLLGWSNLPRYLWILGDTQFRILCAIAALLMMITVGASCLGIKEKDASLDEDSGKRDTGLFDITAELSRSVRSLPVQVRRVCTVQFFAWIGWFPVLFYITTYVGGVYTEPYFADDPNMAPDKIEEIWERGTRVASMAMFAYSVVTLVTSVVAPWWVSNPYRRAETSRRSFDGTDDEGRLSFGRVLRHLEIPWLTLRRTWLLSHILFFILTWLTLLVKSTFAACVLVALIGISWAVTQWAPFALIAAEIREHENNPAFEYRSLQASDAEIRAQDKDVRSTSQAGVTMGLHNVAIAAPQVVATVASSAIFQALQKPRGTAGDDSVAWILRLGGLSTLFAAWLTTRVREAEVRAP